MRLFAGLLVAYVLAVQFLHSDFFGCGVNVLSTHLLIYGTSLAFLVLIMAYTDLILHYFIKTQREQKIGFLIERKKEATSSDQEAVIPPDAAVRPAECHQSLPSAVLR